MNSFKFLDIIFVMREKFVFSWIPCYRQYTHIYIHEIYGLVYSVLLFNATFNNISVISWRSVLLVEETGVPGENHQPVASHRQTLSHSVVSSTACHEQGSNLQLHSDRHLLHMCSCKSNHQTISTTTAPLFAFRNNNKVSNESVVYLHIAHGDKIDMVDMI